MIGLMDCNNFFVSCERLFRPDLVGKPVAVLSSNDGCIVARSQEVKAMGVPMGIPLFQAKQLVDMSAVTLFSSNFTLYRDISRRVMHVLSEEVGEAEVYSVDEAFFTLPDNTTGADLATLRQRVMVKTGIPVSIGLAATKTRAKIASELAKQGEGVTRLDADTWPAVAEAYQCGEVWNIGRSTATKLREAGVKTCAELLARERAWLGQQFGIAGCRLYDELSGIAVHPVTYNTDRIRQSVTSTRSFATVTTDYDELASAVSYHVVEVAKKLRQQKLYPSRLHVVARASRHSDFRYQKGSVEVALPTPTNETQSLLQHALQGLVELYAVGVPYKKAGIVASGLMPDTVCQGDLFTSPVEASSSPLDTVTDTLNQRFGAGTIRPAIVRGSGPRTSALLRSQHYTTAWSDIPSVQTQ